MNSTCLRRLYSLLLPHGFVLVCPIGLVCHANLLSPCMFFTCSLCHCSHTCCVQLVLMVNCLACWRLTNTTSTPEGVIMDVCVSSSTARHNLKCEHVLFTLRALGSCGHQRGQFVAGGLTWAALCGASQPPRLEGTLPLSSRGQPGSKDAC